MRYPVYGIYGFVRYADEIVDTFHDHDKRQLLNDFRQETFKAISQKISLNPVLHAFQLTVNKYKIDHELIDVFLRSMEMDLDKKAYNDEEYRAYIYGSANVIGLMCLRVFCDDDERLYQSLIPMACNLGSAFQKINFLRDIKADHEERGRIYFPGVDLNTFNEQSKQQIEADIKADFDNAYEGIQRLPRGAKLGVYVAYSYYLQLYKKIVNTSVNDLLQRRIRVSGTKKAILYVKAVMSVGLFEYFRKTKISK